MRSELSDIISRLDIPDTTFPRGGLLQRVTIVNVDVTPDLSQAIVSFSALGNRLVSFTFLSDSFFPTLRW
jgi:ribosome-binding factor A